MVRKARLSILFIPLDTYLMADLTLIRDLASALILALDKSSSPNDIIEGFEDALDVYEQLIQTYHQK